MRRGTWIGSAALAAGLAVTIGWSIASADDQSGPGVAARVPAPPDAAQAQRVVDTFTAPGRAVASGDGLVVESVAPTPPAGARAGAAAAPALRLTLRHGPFQVRALPIVVQVDGHAIGRARPSADLQAATVVSLDASWLHAGAHVTWSYGDGGPATDAGTVAEVQP